MAHGLCPAFKVGGLCCLFGTFRIPADLEVAPALTSWFLPGTPCGFGIKEITGLAALLRALPDRRDPLGNTWPLLAHTPGTESSLSKAACPDPPHP